MKSIKLKDIIKENDESVDTKVENAVKKMKEFVTEEQDVVSALIELSKLVDEKEYTNVLKSVKDIHKEYEKFEKRKKDDENLIIVDTHYITKYVDSIKAALFVCAKNKFNNKEISLLTSCF
jgi:tRNA uridine 5-carbamoylmethylation protein Kti12